MAGQLIATAGSFAPAPGGRSREAGACTEPGRRLRAGARALLSFLFVVYVTVVAASVWGVAVLAHTVTAWAVLVLAALAACWGGRDLSRAAHAGSERALPALEKVGRAAAVSGAAALAAASVLAILLPVGAYDALGYRLPAVAQWLDAGRVVWVGGDDPLRNGYPLGLEVVEAVFFRAFDSAGPVDAVAVLFVLAGALALAALVRGLGGARWAALLAFGLFALVPMQILNAPSGYADAALSGALVALFAAVVRWCASDVGALHIKGTRASVVDIGVAAALVIALKPHGFALAGLAVAGGMWSRAARVGVAPMLRELALAGPLAACGLYFAVRNVVQTGNPLYPLEVTLFGEVWLKGESSLDGILTPAFNVPAELAALPAWLRPAWVWLQPHGPAVSFDDRLAGLGYAFPLLGLPAIGWAVWRGVSGGPKQRGVLVFVLITLACLLITPFAFWPRFTSWLWGAAALAIALLVSELAQRGDTTRALLVSLSSLCLAVPEALYALTHVKRLDKLGFGLFGEDPVTRLSQVAGIERDFIQRALRDKRDVCRTPWRLGTDDANLDGIVAQLSPRPRMHVIDEADWDALPNSARAHGCDTLIVIGDPPLVARAPRAWASRIASATAFGRCHLISLSSSEVNP